MSGDKRPTFYRTCTIVRTFKRITRTVNVMTHAWRDEKVEMVTAPCEVPLFCDDEMETGICRGCATGWEVGDNRFATEKERERAMESRGSL